MTPIGTFTSDSGAAYKFSVPRQGAMHPGHPGVVHLLRNAGFEPALRDLEGFDRIWLLFLFDRNQGWHPTVRPPIPPADHERVGVFASRSPYRPNPVGLSCVRLLGIQGLDLEVDEADLLDGTPIIDIKPYIPKIDAFPNARAGWVDSQRSELWEIIVSGRVETLAKFLLKQRGPDLVSMASVQLRENPFDATRKRVVRLDETHAVLSLRMFRIDVLIDMPYSRLTLADIRSGYTVQDLLPGTEDPYGDKSLHRAFQAFKDSFNSIQAC